ncbi:MAG: tRNA (adenosine(37)-N6)-threonylcarbamoyltransferase complex dimerization subunit type 1 TsaB [Pseudomonadota bacterium]
MRCLALDFAGPVGQMAIADETGTQLVDSRPAGPGTVEGIVPFLLAGLTKAGFIAADIDLFVATTGPGSFTGIRAGLAAANGFALAADRPLFGLTVFDALALSYAQAERPLLIALDGRRSDIFVQARAPGGTPLGEPTNRDPDDIHTMAPAGPIALAGTATKPALDGLVRTGRAVSELEVLANADRVDIAHLATMGTERPDWTTASPPLPFYGRDPDARRPA